jgi:hypothetical protein
MMTDGTRNCSQEANGISPVDFGHPRTDDEAWGEYVRQTPIELSRDLVSRVRGGEPTHTSQPNVSATCDPLIKRSQDNFTYFRLSSVLFVHYSAQAAVLGRGRSLNGLHPNGNRQSATIPYDHLPLSVYHQSDGSRKAI